MRANIIKIFVFELNTQNIMLTPEQLAELNKETKTPDPNKGPDTIVNQTVVDEKKDETKTPDTSDTLTKEEETELESILNIKPGAEDANKSGDPNKEVKTEGAQAAKLTPDQEKQLSDAAEILGNKHIKALSEYLKNGGDIEAALAKLSPAAPDYDNMKEEELFSHELNRLGLDDEAKKASIDHFNKLAPYQKKQEIERIKASLKSIQPQKSEFESILGTPDKSKQPTPDQIKKYQNNMRTAAESLSKDLDELESKGYLGVSVSKEDRKEIADVVSKLKANTQDSEGIPAFDYKELLEFTLYKKYKDKAIENARKEGGLAVYKKYKRPSTEQVSTAASGGQGKSNMEENKEALDTAYGKK